MSPNRGYASWHPAVRYSVNGSLQTERIAAIGQVCKIIRHPYSVRTNVWYCRLCDAVLGVRRRVGEPCRISAGETCHMRPKITDVVCALKASGTPSRRLEVAIMNRACDENRLKQQIPAKSDCLRRGIPSHPLNHLTKHLLDARDVFSAACPTFTLTPGLQRLGGPQGCRCDD